jgi:hypothetical protein
MYRTNRIHPVELDETGVATLISSTIYGDGVVEMKVKCPHCKTTNIHTITKDYQQGKQIQSRVCHNLICQEYNLPMYQQTKKRNIQSQKKVV